MWMRALATLPPLTPASNPCSRLARGGEAILPKCNTYRQRIAFELAVLRGECCFIATRSVSDIEQAGQLKPGVKAAHEGLSYQEALYSMLSHQSDILSCRDP